MSTNIPIIESLMKWINEQDPGLELTMANSGSWFNIRQGKSRLGQVTLIFPGQELKQALQYDWYEKAWPIIEGSANAFYYRMVYGIAEPNSFSEILNTAQSLRDGKEVKWHQVFIPHPKGLKLIEGTNA